MHTSLSLLRGVRELEGAIGDLVVIVGAGEDLDVALFYLHFLLRLVL